jgi:hypothetical protein
MKSVANPILGSQIKNKFGHRAIDRFGMLFSVLCGFHCLLTPFILVSVPWFSSFISNEVFHLVMLLLVIPVVVMSIIQNNGINGWTLKVMLSGICLLGLGVLVHYTHSVDSGVHHFEDLILENLFTMTGGGLLFCAHLKKLKNCHCGHSH